jgi:hypothetical protein
VLKVVLNNPRKYVGKPVANFLELGAAMGVTFLAIDVYMCLNQ